MDVTALTPLIQVFDMPASVRFYCGMLGCELVTTSPQVDTPEGRMFHWALLRLGDAHLMLNSAFDEGERPSGRDAERQAAHGDTALYFACRDVDAVHAELTGKGLDIRPPQVAPYGMKQLHLVDPDGYSICFQHPA